jgi:uncharacterized protein
MNDIIDAHCHYGTGDGLAGPWDTRAPVKKYLVQAREAGIGRSVFFAPFHSNYAKANREVAKLVMSQPDRFFGLAFVHAHRDQGRIFAMVKEAVVSYGFKGIKAHRHDAPISREICETARAFRLPVLYDVMGKVETVELFASEYPDVAFIIPHLGSFADDWRAQLSFIPILERHANVFTDTSGVRRFDLLEMALERAGAGKILFGSDGPWLHPGVELEKVYALKLPPAEERKILSGNFLRLIRNISKTPVQPVSKSLSATRAHAQQEMEDPWAPRGFSD